MALGICLHFFLLALSVAASTPVFEAPDEGGHFVYIHGLLETGHLPVMWQAAPGEPLSWQSHHPPLYYLIGAALVSWTTRDDLGDYFQLNPLASIGFVSVNNQNANLHNPGLSRGDTATAVLVLRLYSMALATGTLWFVYLTGRLAASQAGVSLLAMLLVVSIPTFVYISSSISNDNLVTCLYAAGVYWCLRLWQQRTITRFDVAALSLILAAIALSKLTGLTLFAIVYGALLIGVYRRRYSWRQAASLVAIPMLVVMVLAGWWYVRNQSLYGDPLGLQRALEKWSRGPSPSSLSIFEAKGIWESFWMVLGHFNIRGPEWLYGYVPIITALGIVGCIWSATRKQVRWDTLLILFAVCLFTIIAVVIASRQINVSQGRVLFPALVGFAPLLVIGWKAVLGRRLSTIVVLPLALMAISSPAYLSRAFARLVTVDALPPDALRIDARAETIAFLAYQLQEDTVSPGDVIRLWIYINGQHVEDPVLFVKALDPVTQTPLGGVDLFPGMALTSQLEPEAIYRVPVAFRLDNALTQGLAPYRLDLHWAGACWKLTAICLSWTGEAYDWTDCLCPARA